MRAALFLHLISAVIWIGGMFLAYVVVRPTVGEVLEGPQRLRMWTGIFRRFFMWVWGAVAIILLSGFAMLGEMPDPPRSTLIMAMVGIIMAAVFFYVFIAPYSKLRQAVRDEDWTAGAAALGRIRHLVALNLALGILNIAVAVLVPMF